MSYSELCIEERATIQVSLEQGLSIRKVADLLEERFGDEIKNIFGIHTSALTANEASYLVGFRTADEIRNRCAKAEKETAKRLLSKGYQRADGQ